jgi:hypothetical protein
MLENQKKERPGVENVQPALLARVGSGQAEAARCLLRCLLKTQFQPSPYCTVPVNRRTEAAQRM